MTFIFALELPDRASLASLPKSCFAAREEQRQRIGLRRGREQLKARFARKQ
jgi:hypothetical protein